MDKEKICQLILAYIKDFDPSEYHQYGNIPALYKLGYERQSIKEAIWSLVSRELAYIDFESGSPVLSDIIITDYGRKYLEDTEISPYDQDDYMNYLLQNVPDLDNTIKFYLRESLDTFATKNYLSSVFCLGAASERLILLLQENYCSALDKAECTAQKDKISKLHNIKPIYETIHKDFVQIENPKRGGYRYFGYNLWEKLDSQVQHVFSLIRTSRNEAGHPKEITNIDKLDAHSHLVIFPRYCITVYEVINILESKSLPTGIVF